MQLEIHIYIPLKYELKQIFYLFLTLFYNILHSKVLAELWQMQT